MNRSHTARWTALAVIAPLTAGAFAATTVWAASHDPREATTATTSQVAASGENATLPDAAGEPAPLVPVTSTELDRIRQRIDEVRAQTVKVLAQAEQRAADAAASSTSAGTTSSSGSSSGSSSSSSSSASSASGGDAPAPAAPQPAPVAKPAPAPAPAPQPAPPPADTTTGAS